VGGGKIEFKTPVRKVWKSKKRKKKSATPRR
jgi:hypothetical protein